MFDCIGPQKAPSASIRLVHFSKHLVMMPYVHTNQFQQSMHIESNEEQSMDYGKRMNWCKLITGNMHKVRNDRIGCVGFGDLLCSLWGQYLLRVCVCVVNI
eukprot:786609_1